MSGAFLPLRIYPLNASQLPNTGRQPSIHSITDYTLAVGESLYAGEAVAAVLAENRYLAEDAAEIVEVDYEPRSVVVALQSALRPAATLVHAQCGSNLIGEKVGRRAMSTRRLPQPTSCLKKRSKFIAAHRVPWKPAA